MQTRVGDVVELRNDGDVVRARQVVRGLAIAEGFTLIDQTKLVTAASELARNTVLHGGGGRVTIETVEEGARRGIRLVFEDEGPGIPDIARALQDGYSSGTGMGLGLGGSRRLVHEFDLRSERGRGTCVTIVRWK